VGSEAGDAVPRKNTKTRSLPGAKSSMKNPSETSRAANARAARSKRELAKRNAFRCLYTCSRERPTAHAAGKVLESRQRPLG
jgi:hypothetical protein